MKRSLKSLSLEDFKYTGVDPAELPDWSVNKRLNFERKKIMKLQEFYEAQRAFTKRWPKKKHFLQDFSEGELEQYNEMLNKLISSKNAEIFARIKNNEQIESASTIPPRSPTPTQSEEEDIQFVESDEDVKPKARSPSPKGKAGKAKDGEFQEVDEKKLGEMSKVEKAAYTKQKQADKDKKAKERKEKADIVAREKFAAEQKAREDREQ